VDSALLGAAIAGRCSFFESAQLKIKIYNDILQ
jgi:hypothetical protein